MTTKILVVGCGFLGSLVSEELFKRFFALEWQPEFIFLDRDNWEERNAANQLIAPRDATKVSKASWMRARTGAYGFDAISRVGDVTQPHMLPVEGLPTIAIDALDNFPARYAVWNWAQVHDVPLLHLGIAGAGMGNVEWTVGRRWEGWHLSPRIMAVPPKGEQQKLQPCQLVQMRGLGLNVALAGAKAATLALGQDLEEIFGLGREIGRNAYTQWDASLTHHALRVEEKEVHIE